MNWSSNWMPSTSNIKWPDIPDVQTFDADKLKGIPPDKNLNSLNALDRDQLLMLWDEKKKAIETAKAEEMELRKYIVDRAFPEKQEGMNTVELGNGYQLKATVKFNYNLAENEVVEKTLDEIAAIGNDGSFIADRLVSWKPSFLLTEYRALQEEADKGDEKSKNILRIVTKMLTITDAAPALAIKEPKVKK